MAKVIDPKTHELREAYKIGIDNCLVCGVIPEHKHFDSIYDKNNFKIHGLCDSCYKEVYGGK